MMLVQVCDIYRAAPGPKRNGMPSVETWSKVKSGIKCRLDFAYKFGSRMEKIPEEFLGKNHGMAFMITSFEVKPRDIIILTRRAGFPADEQYDVEYVDPVLDSVAVHHIEVTISKRDNLVDLG